MKTKIMPDFGKNLEYISRFLLESIIAALTHSDRLAIDIQYLVQLFSSFPTLSWF